MTFSENCIKILFNAIRQNDLALVRELLEKDSSLLELQDGGWTALHVAGAFGRIEMLELFIQTYNIDINQINPISGNHILHCSSAPVIQWLYKRQNLLLEEVPLTFRNSTPLHTAASSGDIERIRAICAFQRDAMIHVVSELGTPLMEALYNGHEVAARELLELGSKVNVEANVSTPLHLALQRDMFDMFVELIKRGANTNVFAPVVLDMTVYRGNLLLQAIHQQRVAYVEVLINNGACLDLNLKQFVTKQMAKWCNAAAPMERLRKIARLLFTEDQALQLEQDPLVLNRKHVTFYEKIARRHLELETAQASNENEMVAGSSEGFRAQGTPRLGEEANVTEYDTRDSIEDWIELSFN